MAKVNKGNFKNYTAAQQQEMGIRRSYNSYLRNRAKLEAQGYGLERELSYKQYKRNFLFAKDAGMNPSGEKMARFDKSFGKREASQISKRAKQRGLNIDAEMIRTWGRNDPNSPYYIITDGNDGNRASFFNYLINRGFDYREAEVIVYGDEE